MWRLIDGGSGMSVVYSKGCGDGRSGNSKFSIGVFCFFVMLYVGELMGEYYLECMCIWYVVVLDVLLICDWVLV